MFNLQEWNLKQIRFTIFLSHLTEENPETILERVFSINKKSISVERSPDRTIAKSEFGTVVLECVVQFNKIDFVFSPGINNAKNHLFFVDTEQTFDAYLTHCSMVLDAFNNQLRRVAVSAESWLPCGGVNEAYSTLNQLIKFVELDPRFMSEFALNVNLQTTYQNLKINRISMLNSIILIQQLALPMQTLDMKKQDNFVVCQTDFNTDAENATILTSPLDFTEFLLIQTKQTLMKGLSDDLSTVR